MLDTENYHGDLQWQEIFQNNGFLIYSNEFSVEKKTFVKMILHWKRLSLFCRKLEKLNEIFRSNQRTTF